MEVITSETGAVLERLSYDAWGKRRNANGTDSVTQLTSNTTHHGYTGHQMNDSVGLINMNGRWYDPTLGRFMQADPTIDGMANLQGYNRYSYVANNPLSYTDPNGFKKFWKQKSFRKAVIVIAVVVVAVYTGGLAASAALSSSIGASASVATAQLGAYVAGAQIGAAAMGGLASGAIIGAAQGFSATGNLAGAVNGAVQGGVTGMFSAGASYGAGQINSVTGRIAANGTIGGVQAEMQGGNFKDGFIAGTKTAAFTEAAMAMRSKAYEWAANNDSNTTGPSAGIQGDGRKLAGGLVDRNGNIMREPFGGCQGCKGELFGVEYPAGGFADYVLESYAGPHDFLDGILYNTSAGYQRTPPNMAVNIAAYAYSGAMIAVATPFAISSMTQQYGIGSTVSF